MSGLPLDGLRVLDLTRLLPGGLCTLTLSDLGADVLKVEGPDGGDYARSRGPHYRSSEPTSSSASFIALNRGKRSISLDLKDRPQRERFLDLAGSADVVVESFRPGVMDRLGVGYRVLREANPGLVYCALSGWGPDGPLAARAGHDINYLASVGLLSLSGTPEEEPVLSSVQIADTSGALLATTAILAALRDRDESGEGQSVDVSLAHSALYLYGMGIGVALGGWEVEPRQRALFSGGVVCYQAYRSSDGWVAIGALEQRFWDAWCAGVGREDLSGRNYEPSGSETHDAVSRIFAERSNDEWEEFAEIHDCCLTVVAGLERALASEYVRERGMVTEVEQPGIEGLVETLGSPLSFSGTPPRKLRDPAPALDEAGDLEGWLV